jgi:hypothetical protein
MEQDNGMHCANDGISGGGGEKEDNRLCIGCQSVSPRLKSNAFLYGFPIAPRLPFSSAGHLIHAQQAVVINFKETSDPPLARLLLLKKRLAQPLNHVLSRDEDAGFLD